MRHCRPPRSPATSSASSAGRRSSGFFDAQGSEIRYEIHRSLDADRSWTDERILDFGCGPGRVLPQPLRNVDDAKLREAGPAASAAVVGRRNGQRVGRPVGGRSTNGHGTIASWRPTRS
jgi:hypothetical protein